MFLGSYTPNLMDSGRIALPKKIRDEITGSKVILTIGFDECIFGFSEEIWIEVTKPELTKPLFSDANGRDLRRKMYSEAVNIELDSQGRFVIPQQMLDYAGINKEVMVIGTGDHFEIWDKNKWTEYRSKLK